MLSIVPIKKSSIELGYYLKQDGNYYIEDVHEKNVSMDGERCRTTGINQCY